MWELIDAGMHARFESNPTVRAALPRQIGAVLAGTVTPTAAASALLNGAI
ncbi:hypothetical protein [Noviherbaspirillum saxi]|nr:hypothetical protein [Noviherbaspirillum saxi]